MGLKGHIVNVERRLFRNVLLPSGKACYASPENIENMKKHAEVGALFSYNVNLTAGIFKCI